MIPRVRAHSTAAAICSGEAATPSGCSGRCTTARGRARHRRHRPGRDRGATRRRPAPAPRAGRRGARPSRRSDTRPPGRARCRATDRAATARGERRHQLLGADARDDLVGRDRAAETAVDPCRRGLAQARTPDGRGVPGRTRRGVDQRAHRDVGHRVDGCADRRVDHPTGHSRGHRPHRAEAVVRVRRRDEGHRRRLTVAESRGGADSDCRSARTAPGRGPWRCTWRSRPDATTRPRWRHRRRRPRSRCSRS